MNVTPPIRKSRWVEATAAVSGLPRALIASRTRKAEIAEARQMGMYAMRRAGFTYPQIGRAFGRDHTTVIHACRRVEERWSTETHRRVVAIGIQAAMLSAHPHEVAA